MCARSASLRTASGKDRSSVFMTKPNTSPPSPHPKQCHSCSTGSILNDGVFSLCSGQQHQKSRPRCFTGTRSPMTATTSLASRTFCMSSSLMVPAMCRSLPPSPSVALPAIRRTRPMKNQRRRVSHQYNACGAAGAQRFGRLYETDGRKGWPTGLRAESSYARRHLYRQSCPHTGVATAKTASRRRARAREEPGQGRPGGIADVQPIAPARERPRRAVPCRCSSSLSRPRGSIPGMLA